MRDSLPSEKGIVCRCRDAVLCWDEMRARYLQPAADKRRAYILPMSPMPMMPTVKPSMSLGTRFGGDCVAAIFAAARSLRSRLRIFRTRLRENAITS